MSRAHRATSAHLQAVYPGIARGAASTPGVYIGRDLHGGSFCYDPWELYAAGRVTGPNMLVLGRIGRGKSAAVKTYVLRQLVFGRQAVMLDPKGENGALCALVGVSPIVLRPDGGVRLNPLDAVADTDPRSALQRRVQIIAAIIGATLGRTLDAEELVACEGAIDGTTAGAGVAPTLEAVVAALFEPSAAAARRARSTRAQLMARARPLALSLRRLVEGDLRGMFDGPTSADIDLDAPLVSFDLSALHQSPALGILMTCVAAWLRGAVRAAPDRRRIVVIDEAWAVLRSPETARWLQAGYKLARADGMQYVAVIHRLSDLLSGGDAGSEQVALARGLLADSETVVVYAQPASELDMVSSLLDLNDVERGYVEMLPRGCALWRVGQESFLVEHRLGRDERPVVDTDHRMGVGTCAD